MEPTELAMKGLTLAGVAVAAWGLAAARSSPALRLQCGVLAATGLVLMVANLWLATSGLGVMVDAAFLAGASGVVALGIRGGGSAPEPASSPPAFVARAQAPAAPARHAR